MVLVERLEGSRTEEEEPWTGVSITRRNPGGRRVRRRAPPPRGHATHVLGVPAALAPGDRAGRRRSGDRQPRVPGHGEPAHGLLGGADPAGQQLFVHYAIGGDEAITAAFHRLAAEANRWTTLGVYHVEPQSSGYPASFPARPAPMHWSLGEARGFTKESIFWFNFFPEQPYLFEKTFVSWVWFQALKSREGVETNQLVAWEGKDQSRSRGVDELRADQPQQVHEPGRVLLLGARRRRGVVQPRRRVSLVRHAAPQDLMTRSPPRIV